MHVYHDTPHLGCAECFPEAPKPSNPAEVEVQRLLLAHMAEGPMLDLAVKISAEVNSRTHSLDDLRDVDVMRGITETLREAGLDEEHPGALAEATRRIVRLFVDVLQAPDVEPDTSDPAASPVTALDGARALRCPTCHARPGEPCTAPMSSGRRVVAWLHVSREDAAKDAEPEDDVALVQDFGLVDTEIASVDLY